MQHAIDHPNGTALHDLPIPAPTPQPLGASTLAESLEPVLSELRRAVELLQRIGQPGAAMEPLVVGREQIAQLFSVSLATVDRWDASGLLGPVGTKKSGRKLFALAELRDWAASGMPPRKQWQATKDAGKR